MYKDNYSSPNAWLKRLWRSLVLHIVGHVRKLKSRIDVGANCKKGVFLLFLRGVVKNISSGHFRDNFLKTLVSRKSDRNSVFNIYAHYAYAICMCISRKNIHFNGFY